MSPVSSSELTFTIFCISEVRQIKERESKIFRIPGKKIAHWHKKGAPI